MREANTTTVNKFKAIEIKLGISSLEISSVQFVQIIFDRIPFTPVHSKRQIKLMSNFKILIQNAFYIETSVCLSVFMFVHYYVSHWARTYNLSLVLLWWHILNELSKNTA
jgi:hypothetical protein